MTRRQASRSWNGSCAVSLVGTESFYEAMAGDAFDIADGDADHLGLLSLGRLRAVGDGVVEQAASGAAAALDRVQQRFAEPMSDPTPEQRAQSELYMSHAAV